MKKTLEINNASKLLILAAILLLIVGCNLISVLDSSSNKTLNDANPFYLTPMEDEEAELMALWLSDSMVAPLSLYRQVKNDLLLIRTEWSDSLVVWEDRMASGKWELPGWSLRFKTRSPAGRAALWMPDSLFDLMESGINDQWNKLLDSFRIDSVHKIPLVWDNNVWVTLESRGRYHGGRLQKVFEQIDQRIHASPDCPPGGESHIVSLPSEDGNCYFFNYRWGDCPSGCMYSNLYYFRVSEGVSELLAQYQFRDMSDYNNRPAWTDTAGQLGNDWSNCWMGWQP